MEKQEYKYFLDEKEDKQSDKLFFKFAIVLFVIYLVVFASAFIFRANFEYITINGCSMQNTLNPNPVEIDNELVQDGVYIKLTQNVNYGDIIVLNKTEEESIIKRALAFGGDYVTIASISYDGNRDYRFMRVKQGSDEVEILNEANYIKSYDLWNMVEGEVVGDVEYETSIYLNYQGLQYNTKTFDVLLDGKEREVVFFEIPDDHVFYMGDNRTGSYDARFSGTLNKSHIEGYVVKIVHNGTLTKQNAFSSLFQQIGDFFSIIWGEISRFFGAKG